MSPMKVAKCSLKPGPGEPMRQEHRLRFIRGVGIQGDSNVGEHSPRQVLLAGTDVYADLLLPEGALRENLLVSGLETERLRSGHIIASPRGVRLRVMMPCEPCNKLNNVRSGLAEEVVGRRGVLARVLEGGAIEKEDELDVLEDRLPPFPEQPYSRIRFVVERIPEGKVSTFSHVAATSGLPAGYVRVIPRVLKGADLETPAHRVVTSRGRLIEKHLPEQTAQLEAEGVPVEKGRVPRSWIWEGDPFRVVEA